MKNTLFILAAAASGCSAQYCSNANQYSCGAILEKPDGSGRPRPFDLSPLCLDDGNAYRGEYLDGTVQGKTFAVNVCGNLADGCEAQQVCVAETDLPLPGITLVPGAGAECVNDPTKFDIIGTAKEYGYLTDCAGASSGTATCSRCNIVAQHTNMVSGGMGGGGTWGQIYDNGVLLEYKQGVQVTWPTVPMGDIQSAVAAPNKPCKGALGWTVTQQFFCDCDLTSKKTTDIFASNSCGPNLNEPCGMHSDGNGKCSFLMKFASRSACYEGYCENRDSEQNSATDGLAGGAKFAIVLGVFTGLFLVTALFLGTRRAQEGYSGNVIALGSSSIFEFVSAPFGSSSSSSTNGGSSAQTNYSSYSAPGEVHQQSTNMKTGLI